MNYYMLQPALMRSLLTGHQLKPWLHLANLSQLTVDCLRTAGVKGVVFDVDNTLTEHHKPTLDCRIAESFAILCAAFPCMIFSNCGAVRHAQLTTMFDLPIVSVGVKKPGAKGFIEVCDKLSLEPSQIAMVGDRLLTDILGGNRAGFKTVLVDPLSSNETKAIAFMRKLERRT